MITAIFGSQTSIKDWSAKFCSPTKTFVATSLDEVRHVVRSADHEARNGSYVALMLSYEAAPAFDSALVTHSACSFPLAWAAVFENAFEIDPLSPGTFETTDWNSAISKAEYDSSIARIRDLIAQGHTYQVNYSFPMTAYFNCDPVTYYEQLRRAQGAQYAAYLDLGRYKILSISPELFFQRRGDHVLTKPMKGTVRRGRWTEEDTELSSWLANSAKDKAENVMIVDLLRNDLGKVSITGSVRVSSLFDLERFKTIWQMTSTVESQLCPGTTLVDLMGALFPCGSITGAPKIRTMELIHQLEKTPRRAYTGTIGLLRPGGDCTFNVAIRTIVVDSETSTATFGVGGGVTIDSTAEREYEECLVKAKFLTTKSPEFDLLESILLEGGEYYLLERHIERLKTSAQFFDFSFCASAVKCALEEERLKQRSGAWKIRLTMTKEGTVRTEATAFLVEVGKLLKVAFARAPVDSSNRLLFHKTTEREFYNSELSARPDCDDVIFYNEHGEVTESTIANVVVKVNRKFVTPPKSAGLLAGTFRDELIAKGEIEEGSITIQELKEAEEVFLINSVRKWMQVSDLL